jgi:glycosyltransferase involved in cell wall biosynthesis
MAEAMLRLIDQPAVAARLGQAARDHVRAHFSMQHSLERLWAIIDRCIVGPQQIPSNHRVAEAEFP